MGFTVLELEGYEADDILGTLASICEAEKTEDGYYKFYTEALTATQFDDTYTFVIEVNGVTATLVYSVNTYAYAMQNDAEMAELAKALYAYGVAAENYEG